MPCEGSKQQGDQDSRGKGPDFIMVMLVHHKFRLLKVFGVGKRGIKSPKK